MKNFTQWITVLLSILFIGYILYNYTPKEKVIETIAVEEKNEDIGLWDFFGIDLANLEKSESVIISNKDDLDLITNMMLEYNNMNTDGVVSFFADSCIVYDLSGKTHLITHNDFETFFDSCDSISWSPFAIVPLKIKQEDTYRTGTIVHSYEKRFKKDGTTWEKDLIEVFYIKDGKITIVDQYGKDISNDK